MINLSNRDVTENIENYNKYRAELLSKCALCKTKFNEEIISVDMCGIPGTYEIGTMCNKCKDKKNGTN